MPNASGHFARLHEAVKTPTPRSASPEAQRSLAAGVERLAAYQGDPAPPVDAAAWKVQIAAIDAAFAPMIEGMLRTAEATSERREMAGVSVAVGTPTTMRHPDRAHLKIHGGAWAVLGGPFVDADAAQSASDGGCVAYSVDYRMLPDHPFPAGLDDCVAVYRELLKTFRPEKIVVAGGSAGGNLTAALALKARDLGLPLPGGLGMFTPVTDMTRQGDSWETNFGFDTRLTGYGLSGSGPYVGDHDPRHPHLSPLFGDFSKGFPPTFLQSGTRDRLLSDTVRMHRALLAADVDAELHVWEAMPHGGFGEGAPEDVEMRRQFQKFVDRVLG
jgi:acetyl esterase/lipase